MPVASLHERILAGVPVAAGAYHRLLLVVGGPGSGKTTAFRAAEETQGWPYVNVSLELSKRLLDLTQKQRPVKAAGLLDEALRAVPGDVLLLDNIELLFQPELALDPIRLLQRIARGRTVVAAWPGSYEGNQLRYAEPGHPEAKTYSKPEVTIVVAGEAESVRDIAAAQTPPTTAQEPQ